MSAPKGSATVFLGQGMRAREVWSALRGHGVEAVLLEQNAELLYGLGNELVAVVVPAAQAEAAREILIELGYSAPTSPT